MRIGLSKGLEGLCWNMNKILIGLYVLVSYQKTPFSDYKDLKNLSNCQNAVFSTFFMFSPHFQSLSMLGSAKSVFFVLFKW